MKHRLFIYFAAALLRVVFSAELWAQTIAISYPGLSGESSSPIQRLKEEGYIDRLYK